MNGVDGHHSTLAEARQRADNHISAGSERDGAIELDWRLFIFISDPRGAERRCELAMRLSPARDVHFAFPCLENSDREAGRGSEPEETDAFARLDACDAQAAESDDAGTEQRSYVDVVQAAGQRVCEVRARQSVFGVTAIHRVAGKNWPVAQIFHFVAAIPAIAVYSAHPGNPHARGDRRFRAFASDDFADNLMAGNQLRPERGQVALHDVQIGATHATREHAQKQMSGDKLRAWDISDN